MFNFSHFLFQRLLVDNFACKLSQKPCWGQCVRYESVVFIDYSIPSDSVPSTIQTAAATLKSSFERNLVVTPDFCEQK